MFSRQLGTAATRWLYAGYCCVLLAVEVTNLVKAATSAVSTAVTAATQNDIISQLSQLSQFPCATFAVMCSHVQSLCRIVSHFSSTQIGWSPALALKFSLMSMTTGCLAGPVAAVVTAVSVHLAEGTTTNTTTIRYQPVILLHQVSLVSEEDMR